MTVREYNEIKNRISVYLDDIQNSEVCAVMKLFCEDEQPEEKDFIKIFLKAKKVEGCSIRTETYYFQVLSKVRSTIKKLLNIITTEDIREYLSEYQKRTNCSNVTLDNIRRILSSFYKWMEEENYIIKSPMRRIHKVKCPKLVKTIFTDEEIEKLRGLAVNNLRNAALMELLISSGIRVGELVRLNIHDVNLDNRSCIVYGKGSKERIVYFTVKTKICLQRYISSRKDKNPALFVTCRLYGAEKLCRRVKINTVESVLNKYGKKVSIEKSNPHKFRRTLATTAIDKGMPIEQVQVLLGHTKIETTLNYSQVYQKNVMVSYQKFLA